jgi:preprotein translocase subunit SecD
MSGVGQFLITITLLLALAPSSLAQNPAASRLSGTWVLNLAKSKMGESTTRSVTLTITSSNNTVNGKTWPPWIYTTDGKKHIFADIPGGPEMAKATWEKSVLVTRLIGRKAKPPFDFTDRWTVSADGRTLTQESTWAGKPIYVYDKQE